MRSTASARAAGSAVVGVLVGVAVAWLAVFPLVTVMMDLLDGLLLVRGCRWGWMPGQGCWSPIGVPMVPPPRVVCRIQQLRGQHGGLGTPLQSELRQDAGHVVLHGLLGEEHLLPDLPVGQALGDVREQLELLLGELGELRRRARRVA